MPKDTPATVPADKSTDKVEKSPKADDVLFDDSLDVDGSPLDIGDSDEGDETDSSDSDAEDTTPAESLDDNSEGDDDSEAEDADADDDLSEFLAPEDTVKKKDNVQKRIDALTAKNRQLEQEMLAIRQTQRPPEAPKYTDAQLQGALQKAFEEGDHQLAWEVMQYQKEATKRELIQAYNAEQGQTSAVHQEWQQVSNDYSRVWETDDGKEIYPGAKSELNILNENSKVYKLAAQFYSSKDADGNPKYAGPGAQRLAVADAVTRILKIRGTGSGEKKKLERALAKEKRKRSLATGGVGKPDEAAPSQPRNEKERLDAYIKERREFKRKRG